MMEMVEILEIKATMMMTQMNLMTQMNQLWILAIMKLVLTGDALPLKFTNSVDLDMESNVLYARMFNPIISMIWILEFNVLMIQIVHTTSHIAVLQEILDTIYQIALAIGNNFQFFSFVSLTIDSLIALISVTPDKSHFTNDSQSNTNEQQLETE